MVVPAGAAMAHPHGDADRIAQVSLGLDRASLTLALMPGVDDGGAIFDHLDLNGDGTLDAEEGAAMAVALLAATGVVVDGEAMPLTGAATVLPERSDVVAGTGAVVVEAGTEFPRLATGDQKFPVTMEPDWFIQPYYFEDLTEAADTPDLGRDDDGVAVSFTAG